MFVTFIIWLLRLFGYDIVKAVHMHIQEQKEQAVADSATLTRAELEHDLQKGDL